MTATRRAGSVAASSGTAAAPPTWVLDDRAGCPVLRRQRVGGARRRHARLLGEEEPVQRLASRVSQWTRSGEAAGGGVRWRESRDGVHACSTGAAGLLAARLAGDRSGPTDGSELAFAARCAAFLAGPLALPSGLVADNARGGRVEPTVWAYNQGLAVGLSVQLHRSGLDGALDRARALAARTVSYFGEQDRLWRQPPCFVAVLGRMLLLLGSADGDPRWSTVVDGYLARVWERARTPDGVTGAGIGKYDREHTLDLAGAGDPERAAGLPARTAHTDLLTTWPRAAGRRPRAAGPRVGQSRCSASLAAQLQDGLGVHLADPATR